MSQADLGLPGRAGPAFAGTHIQFYVGGAFSGAPPHFHNHAWNGLAYGRKRWFLWPPSVAFYSSTPILTFLREEYQDLPPSARPLEVTQEAGDLLFVPNGWGHGVLNLQESIGLAEEFTLP